MRESGSKLHAKAERAMLEKCVPLGCLCLGLGRSVVFAPEFRQFGKVRGLGEMSLGMRGQFQGA